MPGIRTRNVDAAQGLDLKTQSLFAYNGTGSDISEGKLVYVSGWNVSSDPNANVPKIALADADAGGTFAEWVTRSPIASGAYGYVFRTHRLTGQATNGSTVGNPAYLSATAGAWTLTAPTAATAVVQRVGRVEVVDASVGVVDIILSGAGPHILAGNELQPGVLAATALGRALMASNLFNAATVADKFAADSFTAAVVLQLIQDGAFAADSATRALFADAIWTTAKLAVGILSADASGRALIATDYFDAATILLKIADGAFAADTATRALFGDGIWTQAKLDPASLDGTIAKVVANANVIGGVPVIHRIDVADASANTDVVLTHKTRIIDAWGLNTGSAAHAANDTWQVKNGSNAISDAVAKTATVNAIKRISTIDPTYHEIAAAGTLRITAVKDTNAAVTVYVKGIRVT